MIEQLTYCFCTTVDIPKELQMFEHMRETDFINKMWHESFNLGFTNYSHYSYSQIKPRLTYYKWVFKK